MAKIMSHEVGPQHNETGDSSDADTSKILKMQMILQRTDRPWPYHGP